MTKKQALQEDDELGQYVRFLRSYAGKPGKAASARWHNLCALWRRDNGMRYAGERFAKCKYCQIVFKLVDLTIDHVVPKSRGGKSEMRNYVLACEPCNKNKANFLLDEWRR